MKFWRNAAALLTVFHPETTHTGNHSTPKDVKNEGRPGYVYENKAAMDTMSETVSAICARFKPFLQKIGVISRVAHTPSFVYASPSANSDTNGRRHTNQCLRPPRRGGYLWEQKPKAEIGTTPVRGATPSHPRRGVIFVAETQRPQRSN